jgi:basic membrane protein A
MKRTLSWIVIIAMLFSIVITGCSSGQETSDAEGAGGTSAVKSSEETKVLKIGSMFNNPDPANQGGWDISQYKGMKALEGNYGWTVSIAENIAYPQVEEVVLSYIDKGYDIVIFPDNGMIETWQKMYPKHPDTYFIMISSTATVPDDATNTTVYQADQYTYGSLVGIVMANMTESKKVGLIGGSPIGSVKYQFSGIIEACKAIDPEIEVSIYFAGDWSDTAKHMELTQIMIEDGVDTFFAMTGAGNKGVYEAAAAAGAKVIGYATDMYEYVPDCIATSVLFDFESLYAQIGQDVMAGTIEQKVYPLGIEYMKLADFRGSVDAEVEAAIHDYVEKFRAGEFKVDYFIHEDILN